jgi:hypothetical protein
MGVIVAYHITFAQEDISKGPDKAFRANDANNSVAADGRVGQHRSR